MALPAAMAMCCRPSMAKATGLAQDTAACLEMPETFAGLGVEGVEVAFLGAAEDQAAGGGEQARPGRAQELELPDLLAGHDVEGADGAPGLVAASACSPPAMNGLPGSYFASPLK